MTQDSKKNRQLNPTELAQLGTIPDYLLSEILKVPTPEIRAQRELRGIPRFVSPGRAAHVWTPEDVELLGTMTDCAVAAKVGTSEFQVENERQRRKISATQTRMNHHVWLPEHDALLGVEFDSQIAIHLHVTTRTVRMRRQELGIPRQRGSGSKTGGHVERSPDEIWTPEMLAKLGTISDSTLAAHLKIHSSEVRAKRDALGVPRKEARHPALRDWTQEELSLLGTMSDTDIAKKLGVNRSRVCVRRTALSIPPFVPKKKVRVWTRDEDALLGVGTDSEVAARLKTTRSIVEKRRNQLGIPRQYANGSKPASAVDGVSAGVSP